MAGESIQGTNVKKPRRITDWQEKAPEKGGPKETRMEERMKGEAARVKAPNMLTVRGPIRRLMCGMRLVRTVSLISPDAEGSISLDKQFPQ